MNTLLSTLYDFILSSYIYDKNLKPTPFQETVYAEAEQALINCLNDEQKKMYNSAKYNYKCYFEDVEDQLNTKFLSIGIKIGMEMNEMLQNFFN